MEKHRIDESFDAKTIQVAGGDTIELRLDESPTTGYRWEITEINKQQLHLSDQQYALREGVGMGGGGVRIFYLEVLHQGAGRIVLENRQRWEGDIYKTFCLYYE
jgi:inhibitor of cysteine peptidase